MRAPFETLPLNTDLSDNPHPLYKEFFDYSLHLKNGDVLAAKTIASRMFTFFMENKHNFATVSYNMKDGIGDFVGQMFYAEKFHSLFASSDNVNLQHVSFITPDKLKAANFIVKGKLPDHAMQPVTQKNIEKQGYDIYVAGKSPSLNNGELYSNVDLLLNISVAFQEAEWNRKNILPESKAPRKDCLIQSFLEYYPGELNRARPSGVKVPIFYESSMGMQDGQVGMRFASDVIAAGKLESNNFHRFSDTVKEKLLGSNPSQDQINHYATDNTFAVAYIKSKIATVNFIALALKGKGDVNVLIDAKMIEELKSDPTFIELLKQQGISKIELHSNDTVNSTDIAENKERTLRIFNFNFNDISEQDKLCFYGLADFIAGSGDTSASEVISSGLNSFASRALPFFENPHSKPIIINSLIEALNELCDKTHTNHPELLSYLELLNKGQKLTDNEINEIVNNKDAILNSWGSLCTFLYQERNADWRFKELLVTYTIHRLITENRIDELISLVQSLGPDFTPHETVLQLVVKSGNTAAFTAIMENHLDKPSLHTFKNYSLFHIAVYNGHLPMLQLLCDTFGDDINQYLFAAKSQFIDSNLFQLAEKKGFTEILDFLNKMKIDKTPALPPRTAPYQGCINDFLAGIGENRDDSARVEVANKIIAKLKKSSGSDGNEIPMLSKQEIGLLHDKNGWLYPLFEKHQTTIYRSLVNNNHGRELTSEDSNRFTP